MKQIVPTACLVLAAAFFAAAQRTPESMLGAAMRQEEVQGDLKGAIAAYQKVVAMRGVSRRTAAEALLHMAGCYQKMGDAESRKIYEQVLKDYADQKDAADLARVKLAAFGGGQAGQQTTRRVWQGAKAYDDNTAVSADGRYISYTDPDTGNLALHDLISGTDRLLTNTASQEKGASAYVDDMAFSKDGRQVAYGWGQAGKAGYEIRLANASGEPNPRLLRAADPDGRFVWPCDWSPDGKSIAAWLGNNRTTQIGLIAVQDGSVRVLLSLPGMGMNDIFDVRFSPDGKYLAYDTLGRPGVYLLAVDGGAETRIVPGIGQSRMVGWSPDGRYLLLTSYRTGIRSLWALPFADGKAHGQPEVVKADLGNVYPMGLSSAGALFYGVPPVRVLPKIELATVDLSAEKFLTPPVDIAEDGVPESNTGADWSPDGKSLAYVAALTTGSRRYSIRIRSVETGKVHELRSSHNYSYYVRWAPDGRSLAIGEGGQILRIDAATGEASGQPLVAGPAQGSIGEVPRWAPDGKRIYYRLSDKNGVAFIERDLATGAEREVIRRPNLGGSNLSPDGKFLVTMLDPGPEKKTMLLIPVDGTMPREVMKLDRKGYSLQMLGSWARDSKSLFARVYSIDNVPGEEEIWQVPIDGRSPRKLDLRLDKHVFGFALQPGGQRIALASGPNRMEGPARPAEVWVLENFLPTAKAAK